MPAQYKNKLKINLRERNEKNMPKQDKLGKKLLEKGVITEEQLFEALAMQRESDKKIGEILVELGYTTEDLVYSALEENSNTYFNLDDYEIDPDIAQKITESLAKKHTAIPLAIEGNELIVAMEDPKNILALEDIKLYSNYEVRPVIATKRGILKAINRLYGQSEVEKATEEYKMEYGIVDLSEAERARIDEEVSSAPIVKMLNSLIEQAVRSRSSDIHIEPYDGMARVRFRVDGNLKEISKLDLNILPALVARIKIAGGMNIAEKRRPQDGRMGMRVDNEDYDLRISVTPTVFGEKIVLRISDKKGFNKPKEGLGLFPDDMKKFDDLLKNPNGMFLVTGPTGSGKTTTLYTTLRELNKENVNIMTIEDPVEATIMGINQVQVNNKAGVDFVNVLRSFLRQDPDIIMIGEIRDSETAEIAVKAAITGHLVVSTLHTNDAASSIARLLDMGVEPFLISTSLVGVIAQRLVKKLCPKCKQEYTPTEKEYECLDLYDKSDVRFYKPVGCGACNNTGYSGRIGVFEILPISQTLKELINRRASTEEIKFVAMREGLNTLWRSCSRLVANGTTTIDELIRIAYSEE